MKAHVLGALLLLPFSLSACGKDVSYECEPNWWWYDGDCYIVDREKDDYVAPSPYVPTPSDPGSLGEFKSYDWIVSFVDQTELQKNRGLSLEGSLFTYVANEGGGSGGKILASIDASASPFLCGTSLVLQLDNVLMTAPITAIAREGSFYADNLNTGCLGGGKGSNEGLAIFEVASLPRSIRARRFVFDTNLRPGSAAIALPGIKVSVHLNPTGRTLWVTVQNENPGSKPVQPILFDATVTSTPFLAEGTARYQKLEFDERVLDFVRSTGRNEITYKVALKNAPALSLLASHRLNVISVRDGVQ